MHLSSIIKNFIYCRCIIYIKKIKTTLQKLVTWIVGGLVGVFVLLQLVRFVVPDFQLDNPPSTQTIAWSSPEVEQLWKQTCADCHSNDTVYPWYSYIAPIGWLVAHDTHEGRAEMNISTDRRVEWDEMQEKINEGEMPLPIYLPLHPEARLSPAEKAELVAGLAATLGTEGGRKAGIGRGGAEEEGEENED